MRNPIQKEIKQNYWRKTGWIGG